jgi:hypothetical protein
MSTAIRVLEKCAFAAGGEDGDPRLVAGREDNRLRARAGDERTDFLDVLSGSRPSRPHRQRAGNTIESSRPRWAAIARAESKRIVFSHGRGRKTGAWIMRRDR